MKFKIGHIYKIDDPLLKNGGVVEYKKYETLIGAYRFETVKTKESVPYFSKAYLDSIITYIGSPRNLTKLEKIIYDV